VSWQRIGRTGLVLAAALAFGRCAAFYADDPRFGRRQRPAPAAPRRAAPRHPLEQQRGRLAWPVSGTVVRQFGLQSDPRYGTRTRNQGIDIACRAGAPVLAIGAGRVSFADVFRGYGRMVIVEHGSGFYSVYAGLSDVRAATGRSVAGRDTLGLAADTVHFEIRVGGRSVDPLAWLARR